MQADEMRVKGSKGAIWMSLAIDATSRLWQAGVVSMQRDRTLADDLMQQVRRCCQAVRALLVCTDAWAASPKSLMQAFRDKVKKTARRGRYSLVQWPELDIATVIKRTQKKRVVEVRRKISWEVLEQAQHLLSMTAGCQQFKTSLIERFNASATSTF